MIRLLVLFALVTAFATTSLLPIDQARAQDTSTSEDNSDKKKKTGSETEEEPDC